MTPTVQLPTLMAVNVEPAMLQNPGPVCTEYVLAPPLSPREAVPLSTVVSWYVRLVDAAATVMVREVFAVAAIVKVLMARTAVVDEVKVTVRVDVADGATVNGLNPVAFDEIDPNVVVWSALTTND